MLYNSTNFLYELLLFVFKINDRGTSFVKQFALFKVDSIVCIIDLCHKQEFVFYCMTSVVDVNDLIS